MKKSYIVNRILTKLAGRKCTPGLSQLTLSQRVKIKSNTFKAKKKIRNFNQSKPVNCPYETYQKEFEASKIIQKPVKIVNPGKILKLPKEKSELENSILTLLK